jgi:outer membrane protein assembly factor BamB
LNHERIFQFARRDAARPAHIRIAAGILLLTAAFAAWAVSGQPDAWPLFRGAPALHGRSAAPLPKTLKLRWSYETKDSIESSAAIVAGVVYVGAMDGSLHAVDLATGRQRWRYKTAGPVQESSPCAAGGLVYVGDLSGVLHAVDAASGKPRWTFKAETEIKSSPNCSADKVYFGSYDQNLYCLSAQSGALVWKYATEGPVHATPAIDRGNVYISGCDETLRVIDARSGKQIMSLPLGAYTGASAALWGDHLYVGTFANEVLGIDLKARVVRWSYKHTTRSFPFYSSAAVTDAAVVFGGRDKMVHCLERSSGKPRWTFSTGARVESSPLIVQDERVFVGSNDGVLYELNLATGKKIWTFTAGAPLSASPAAAQGALVIGSQDGVLYCFANP